MKRPSCTGAGRFCFDGSVYTAFRYRDNMLIRNRTERGPGRARRRRAPRGWMRAPDTSRVLATLPEPNVRIRKSESATTPRDQRDREAKAQQHAATMRSATREVDDAGKLQYVEYEHGDGERTCSHHREQSRAIKSHQEPSRAVKNKREPSRAIKSNQE